MQYTLKVKSNEKIFIYILVFTEIFDKYDLTLKKKITYVINIYAYLFEDVL